MTTEETNTVPAAGTVLWRNRVDGHGRDQLEVAVVHRPRYDDWSLPKGKAEPGETLPACAVRETREETGFLAVLGRLVDEVSYRLTSGSRAGARKTISYYAGQAVGGGFRANDEVDDLRWLRPERAAVQLTYDADRAVLDAFTQLPVATRTVLLVRHAKAGSRANWPENDDLRPLSRTGQTQADALRVLLRDFGADRVFAADRVRCVQTVQGLADDLGVPVGIEQALTEESYHADPQAAARRVLAIAEDGGIPAICSQGGAIPALIEGFADASALALDEIPCKKGSVWVLSFAPDEDRLLAADYLPTALPVPVPTP
ncbi:MAG TPA: NUDIX hydrolase [Pseudonocardiaceae bacterium]|jgi:8-oxo-dGTP diphosphatase|nr:NUDIX hydrolase [Pseudonocardiaceae bacterium]